MAEQRLSNMRQRNGFIALDDFAVRFFLKSIMLSCADQNSSILKLIPPSKSLCCEEMGWKNYAIHPS